MDFSSSSEEKLIRESLKKLLESFSGEDYLKKFDSHRYDPALLSKLIDSAQSTTSSKLTMSHVIIQFMTLQVLVSVLSLSLYGLLSI